MFDSRSVFTVLAESILEAVARERGVADSDAGEGEALLSAEDAAGLGGEGKLIA